MLFGRKSASFADASAVLIDGSCCANLVPTDVPNDSRDDDFHFDLCEQFVMEQDEDDVDKSLWKRGVHPDTFWPDVHSLQQPYGLRRTKDRCPDVVQRDPQLQQYEYYVRPLDKKEPLAFTRNPVRLSRGPRPVSSWSEGGHIAEAMLYSQQCGSFVQYERRHCISAICSNQILSLLDKCDDEDDEFDEVSLA